MSPMSQNDSKGNVPYSLAKAIARTITPRIILYMAKPLKLPFCRYCSKNLITKIPTIKLASTPM